MDVSAPEPCHRSGDGGSRGSRVAWSIRFLLLLGVGDSAVCSYIDTEVITHATTTYPRLARSCLNNSIGLNLHLHVLTYRVERPWPVLLVRYIPANLVCFRLSGLRLRRPRPDSRARRFRVALPLLHTAPTLQPQGVPDQLIVTSGGYTESEGSECGPLV